MNCMELMAPRKKTVGIFEAADKGGSSVLRQTIPLPACVVRAEKNVYIHTYVYMS